MPTWHTGYGLSRDDSGRFLPLYVERKILPDDPFQVLDREGVGELIRIATERGLSGLAFADPGEERAAFADMTRRWPNATYIEDSAGTAPLASRVFNTKLWRPDQPLRVVLIGTDFEVRVWETLLKIPMGRAVSYSDIACKIKNPRASRLSNRRTKKK